MPAIGGPEFRYFASRIFSEGLDKQFLDLMPSVLVYLTTNHYCYDTCGYIGKLISAQIEDMKKSPEGFTDWLIKNDLLQGRYLDDTTWDHAAVAYQISQPFFVRQCAKQGRCVGLSYKRYKIRD
jgi:hypothetical protein